MIGFVSAICAGCCAAIASTCAKLAMSPELQRIFWCDFLLQKVFDGSTLSSVCQTVSPLLFPSSQVLKYIGNQNYLNDGVKL